jgi:hypothetical protein
MDPVGFALENFDAVGRWRSLVEGQTIDGSGGMADGRTFTGVEGLERALLAEPEVFVSTLVEKLMIFALGRGLEPSDAPAVRAIVRTARVQDYRFSALIEAAVQSVPFSQRRSR